MGHLLTHVVHMTPREVGIFCQNKGYTEQFVVMSHTGHEQKQFEDESQHLTHDLRKEHIVVCLQGFKSMHSVRNIDIFTLADF